ncbi:MAG: DUF5565 family protein [Promethearchaeota archaeon]
MKKIISLFKRNYNENRLVINEIVEGAEWVINGEGIATRKFDGTCCKIENGKLYKRYDAKKGKKPPKEFISAQEPDFITGHWPGWVPVTNSSNDKWHNEAMDNNLSDGTYELCGPKIQGNPEKYEKHILIPHGQEILFDVPTTFEDLKEWFKNKDIEGIVWHHSDGRMVKIKKKDFGYKRGIE